MPQGTYDVECRHPAEPPENFVGLGYDRAIERTEIERGKTKWASITVRKQSNGEVLCRYHGGGALSQVGK